MNDHHAHDHATPGAASCSSNASFAPKKPHRQTHPSGCCDGHHHHHQRTPGQRSSLLGAILPILACALCPTCIGIWAQVLSAVGVGVVVTEAQHHVLLAVAIIAALSMGAFRYVRTRIAGPFLLTLLGCAGLGASHFAEENHLLSWLSIAVIIAASLWQRRAERSAMVEPANAAMTNVSSEIA